jgi:DNA-binding NarL/FixJ family response regulator
MPNPDPAPAENEAPAVTQLPDSSIRPLVVDNHEATRLGTALVLRRESWVARCLLAADIQEALAITRRHRPEVAVLDISNAGPFIPSATAQLRDAHPGIAIVLTSRCRVSAPEPATLGARAFLPSGSSAREIAAAVRAAVLSVEYRPAPAADEPLAQLTDRERDLLLFISQGATNREIAEHLHLGPDSVKKSASALYRKLGVRNRAEAAQKAAHLLGFAAPAGGATGRSPFGPKRNDSGGRTDPA